MNSLAALDKEHLFFVLVLVLWFITIKLDSRRGIKVKVLPSKKEKAKLGLHMSFKVEFVLEVMATPVIYIATINSKWAIYNKKEF